MLSVIVPIHNETDNIFPFYERTLPILQSLGLENWEIVFVNNASEDDSLQKVLELRRKDPRVKIITLSRNFGYHSSLMAGLSRRDSELYAIIDVDCEDPPEMLAKFYEEIKKGAHTVYGIRSERDEHRFIMFFRWLFYWINRQIADGPVMLWMAEFGMMTRTVRDYVQINRSTFPFLRAELGYVGLKMVGLPYHRASRQRGVSHYNFFRMSAFAIGGFLSSSTFPLRLALYLAPTMTVGYLVLVVFMRAGLAQAAQLASIFSFAFIMMTLPMISVYLARTYKDVDSRPTSYVDPDSTFLT